MQRTEVRTYFEDGPFVDLDAMYQPVRKAQRLRSLAFGLEERSYHRPLVEQVFRQQMAQRAAQRTIDAYTEYLRATHGVTIATIEYNDLHSEGYGRFEVIDNSWAF